MTSPETRVVSADISWKSVKYWFILYLCTNKGKLKKEIFDIYVFEDARLDGTKNENVREMIKPEINMTDENPKIQEFLERIKL